MVINCELLQKNGINININDYDEEKVKLFCKVLDDKEVNIINYHYGLDGSVAKSIDDVVNKFHLSKSCIDSIEDVAFMKIRLLYAFNNYSLDLDADTVIWKAEGYLKAQQVYDDYYRGSRSDYESKTTKYYKKIIKIASEYKKANSSKNRTLGLDKTNLQ